ncbi:MAG TPA: transglutaminase family protein [Methylomirabilota bacterium]|jgi:transglutaminase-like putative cysteine protease|nr:transglutaminase family protein [Methylomirabilota bacterium]
MLVSSEWLGPTPFVDSDAPGVVAFARGAGGGEADPRRGAVALYYAVRDGVTYTPYCDYRSPETYRASAVLDKGAGFCVGKAALLTAAARAAGIPARLRFADVRNHLCTPRLRELVGGDVFYYHGYVELELEGRWVKATPAFDKTLCDRFGVPPLEFDGREDSIFQPYDRAGRRHMEYLEDRGVHADVPVAQIMETFAREYPRLVARAAPAPTTQFREEAS